MSEAEQKIEWRVARWRVCRLHPDVDADRMWGCPECVRALRQRLLSHCVCLFVTDAKGKRVLRQSCDYHRAMQTRAKARVNKLRAENTALREALESLVQQWEQWLHGKSPVTGSPFEAGVIHAMRRCADELVARLRGEGA